ncbi:MAG TPA: orotidine 5'-phosphate decarboxylase, partial [Ruminiclostridium sp.]|nr:orotidine 5'-phosphate decarboxylase [Ruminiclostridium sp.]
MNFSDRLAEQIQQKQNPSLLGLDPKLEYIPDSIKKKAFEKNTSKYKAAAQSIVEFNTRLV